jgi:hypothetical protein
MLIKKVSGGYTASGLKNGIAWECKAKTLSEAWHSGFIACQDINKRGLRL